MFEWAFRVAYADTDAMGVVHHSRYFRYLEQWRVEWIRSTGESYQEMEARGMIIPLTQANIEYIKPLRFDDEAVVRATVEATGKTRFLVSYEVYRGSILCSRARTDHVLVKKTQLPSGEEKWIPERIPENWSAKWRKLSESK